MRALLLVVFVLTGCAHSHHDLKSCMKAARKRAAFAGFGASMQNRNQSAEFNDTYCTLRGDCLIEYDRY